MDRTNKMRRRRSGRKPEQTAKPERRRYAGEPTSGDTTVVLAGLGLVGSLVGVTVAWWVWDERREKRLRAELAR